MQTSSYGSLGIAALLLTASAATHAATIQIGASGKTFASSAVACAANPVTGLQAPFVEAGLYKPSKNTTATVSLNGAPVAQVDATAPATTVWLADGANSVGVALSRKQVDRFAFTAPAGMCALPDTSGNTFSGDGTLEFGASGKSYATVTPGCAFNPASGQAQPFVNVFDNGNYLLNVSVNGVPLTQLDPTRQSHTPVFLRSGQNVISVANGYVSTDDYVRDGGTGTCTLQ